MWAGFEVRCCRRCCVFMVFLTSDHTAQSFNTLILFKDNILRDIFILSKRCPEVLCFLKLRLHPWSFSFTPNFDGCDTGLAERERFT